MSQPHIVAHRGGSVFPENSMAGFRYACELGAEQLEFDIHLTRDGELTVIHDVTLEQTTTGSGPVRELSLRELSAVRLRGVDEGVPTFDAVMAYLATQAIHVRIEIKDDDRPGAYAAMHERVTRTLARHDMAARATLMSFDVESLVAFSADGVNTSVSYMRHGQDTPAQFDAVLRNLRERGIDDVGLSFAATTAHVLERVAANGLTAGVWTVNGPGRLDYWLHMPVAYVLTDQPDLALQLRSG